ncbi:hypothetical protein BGZ65_000956 [Modicella reniformis]|uniref:TEA domain-containing protein n=1 Tax=Modicella reniformis TaxID=1440133 RepID=A0A9P6J5G2_9FUNG|nr:hypothetical protein BGZ65_000956 [Modicella reniformis]
MEIMSADMFAATNSEDGIACAGYPFQSGSLSVLFDIPPLTPSSSQASISPLEHSDQDSFHTPPPTQLMSSPFDLASCDQGFFSRRLFEALLYPITNTPTTTTTGPILPLFDTLSTEQPLLQTIPEMESNGDGFNNQDLTASSSPALQNLEMTDATVKIISHEEATICNKKPAIEKRGLTRPTGTIKRYSVSRQAHQPPLVTHQHHTPPPFVSPLLQYPHHRHQHHQQHKSGSLDLTKTTLCRFLQQQQQQHHHHQQPQQQQQHQNLQFQHGNMSSVGLVAMQVPGISNHLALTTCPVQSDNEQLNVQQPSQEFQTQQDLQQEQEQEQPSSLELDTNAVASPKAPPRVNSSLKRRLPKDKVARNDREEVWPTDVEKVFYEALEVIPKLGRRKVLVDGKPCGRNELVADYIFKRTNKIRTRKQVSSHIQVLKNTRKGDATPEASPTSPIAQDPTYQTRPTAKKHRHSQSLSSMMSENMSSPFLSPLNCRFLEHSVYPPSETTSDTAVSLSGDMGWQSRSSPEATVTSGAEDGISESMAAATMADSSMNSEIIYPFWPNVFGLFTEYVSDMITLGVSQMHSLARSRDLGQKSFGSINVHQLPQEKFPTLHELYQKTMCTFLFFKIKLDLNLNLNGVFGNTSLFDSTERRLVECTTSIYSFGNKVLEAKELKQAAMIDNTKFVYSFEFVNQFFGAFLNGIRSLKTWGEIDIALTCTASCHGF